MDKPVNWKPSRRDYVHIEGRQYHVIDSGRGASVVALHGLGSIGREMSTPLSGLSGRYRLVAPDRPGYGASEPLEGQAMSPEGQAVWLRGILSRIGAKRPILVGHSIACATALCYAARWPEETGGLVLVAPYCRPSRPELMPLLRLALLPVVGAPIRRWAIPEVARRLGPSKLAAAFAPGAVPEHLTALPFQDLVTSSALFAMAAELNAYNAVMIRRALSWRRLSVPTVVLAGAADRTAEPARHARWIAGRLPRARLTLLPSAGHMLHHVFPQLVIQAVDELAKQNAVSSENRLCDRAA